jgi:hypothetical protein
MSIFSNIASAAHTFAAWVEKEWSAVYKATPGVEKILAATLKYAGPALQLVVTSEAGAAAGAIVAKVIADAQAGLLAASGLVYDFGAQPSFAGILSGIQADLGTLLSAGHVTNATNVDIVTKVVNSLNSIISALTAPPASPAA